MMRMLLQSLGMAVALLGVIEFVQGARLALRSRFWAAVGLVGLGALELAVTDIVLPWGWGAAALVVVVTCFLVVEVLLHLPSDR